MTDEFSGVVWSPDAELDVLAAVLYSPKHCDVAFERLTPGHFQEPLHSRIWEAVVTLQASGVGLELPRVAHHLGADPGFEAAGGMRMLADLYDKASVFGIKNLTEVLCDLYVRRSLEALSRETIARARDTGDADGGSILAALEKGAADISQGTAYEEAWAPVGDMMIDAFDHIRSRDGKIYFPVGLTEVDDKLGGLNAGETTTIAAWTGMGKTLAAMQVAKGCGSAGLGVAYFSLEMGATPMAIRMACDLAYDRSAASYGGQTTNITVDRALKGLLSGDEWKLFQTASETVSDWPIFYDTRPNLTVAQIQASTVRLHRRLAKKGIKPGPVIIDHIGKIRPSQDRRGNVTSETRDVSNDLDAMAKRLGVPVVILSQLNRNEQTSTSKDKRPTLASIKDSGALAENSRQIIFVYRPEYYYREPFEHEDFEAKADRMAELRKVQNHLYWIIEKNSNGPRAQVLTYCKAECSAIRDWN